MARQRISNRAEVIDEIIMKFETLEEFSAKTGCDYRELIGSLLQGHKANDEILDIFRIHGIDVSLTEK